MSTRVFNRNVTGDAPSSASTAALSDTFSGLREGLALTITAQFAGNTGGTLDVYLQRYDDALEAWVDWVHFPQAAAGAASATYVVAQPWPSAAIYTVGTGTSPALAANSFTGGIPGEEVRVLCVSGASTTDGATVTVAITGNK